MMNRNTRKSGILLHPTSLPGKSGIGTLGGEAFEWIDFLELSGQKLWQVFPLGPTGYGDSPYQCFSAFAGNPLLISLEQLVSEGLLKNEDLQEMNGLPKNRVDFGRLISMKTQVLKKAFQVYSKNLDRQSHQDFDSFRMKNKVWLDDFALYMALKERFAGKPWHEWPQGLKNRANEEIEPVRKESASLIEYHQFSQFIFYRQWSAVRDYAHQKGIEIIGDIPIFIAHDSADAWAHPELFYFSEDRQPLKVAGCPPDYFSKTGQLWGNPLYNWRALKDTGYQWWIDRFQQSFELFDRVRLDHFRGFSAYWAIPYGSPTAETGIWEPGPGKELFIAAQRAIGRLPIIAEDLGIITPDVVELREELGFPGMKILQFAFDSNEANDYLPHHYEKNSVVYTGTHDNDTTKSWFKGLNKADKKFTLEYLNSNGVDITWDLIRLAWSSTSLFAVIPMQDLLNLGKEARMNTPGTLGGNWQWRMQKGALTRRLAEKLKKLTKLYNR